ncbi:MAG: hypothetical protein SO415_03060 [Oliverpabstia sp.]|nr:hypothetical protein [Oliverpabstia sp.]
MDDREMKLEQLIAYGSKAAIIQNLKDAGCSQETIDCCITCLDMGQKEELLKRLDEHRKGLLDKVHEGEKQIDCLDYLVFQIGRSSFSHDEF